MIKNIFFLSLLFSSSALFANTASLPPIVSLILDDAPITRLEKTLQAYKDPNSNHIFIAAHRGGKDTDSIDQIPGNSIANIDNALAKEYDIYESDIEIIKNNTPTDDSDDTLVVFHDDYFRDLTNSDKTGEEDQLDNQTLSFAKSLLLTYDNGGVSSEQIPTLEEFLNAIKGKMLVKFDLKSGTFGGSVIRKILDTVVQTNTVEQVFIRAGQSALDVAKAYETSSGTGVSYTSMMMLRLNSMPTVMDIQNLAASYDVRAISIPGLSNLNASIVTAATNAGLIVEVHESQGVSSQQMELDYQTAIDLGVRQFHSFKPSQIKQFLDANNYREF